MQFLLAFLFSEISVSNYVWGRSGRSEKLKAGTMLIVVFLVCFSETEFFVFPKKNGKFSLCNFFWQFCSRNNWSVTAGGGLVGAGKY